MMARTIMGGYKAYGFREHDLVLDKLSRLFELAGVMKANGQPDLKKIEEKSGVKYATLSRWNLRHVKRPQNAGVTAVVNGLGGSYDITFDGKRLLAGRVVTRNDVIKARAAAKASRKIGRGSSKKKRKAA